MLKARCRVWLEKNGRPVFGDGRAEAIYPEEIKPGMYTPEPGD